MLEYARHDSENVRSLRSFTVATFIQFESERDALFATVSMEGEERRLDLPAI
jgi:hypothetical protein